MRISATLASENVCVDIFDALPPYVGNSSVIVSPQPRNTSIFEKHSPYFLVDTKLHMRWAVPLHSLFALGFQAQNILVGEDARQIISKTRLQANKVGTLSRRSWYTLAALQSLMPSYELIKLAGKNAQYTTLIDIQVDLLQILDNSLTFMQRFAENVFSSVVLVAYDARSCVERRNDLFYRSEVPCYHDNAWLRSIRMVTKNLHCNRKCKEGYDMNLVMVGRLVTTLSLLCAGLSVFLTDTDVILLEDPMKYVSDDVDMIFAAERRKIKKFYSSTPPGRWYIRPLVHNVSDFKYASFALNNGVVYYKHSNRVLRWYLYFSEFLLMNLDDGFLQTNFVEFFKQHRPLLFSSNDILIEKLTPKTKVQIPKGTSVLNVIELVSPSDAVIGSLRNKTIVSYLISPATLEYCIDCAFGVTWISPRPLLPDNTSFWMNSKKVWERAVEFTITGTNLASDDQIVFKDDSSGFPLVIGMFSNFRWVAHCMQLQELFPTLEQKRYISNLFCYEKNDENKRIIAAYHSNCSIPQGPLRVRLL